MDRPDLAAVLDHYDVQYIVGKNRQVVRCPAPLHDDLVSSFSIDLEEGVVNCFGCSLRGSSLDLIMAMEGLDIHGAAQLGQTLFPGSGREGVRDEPRFGKRVPPGKGFAPKYRRAVPARRRHRTDGGA